MTGVALGLAPQAACAQTPSDGFDRTDQEGVISLIVENDSLSSGADRNYTSGIELSYTSPNNARIPRWLDNAARPFTQFFSNAEPTFWGVSLGQSLFTPNDIEAVPAAPLRRLALHAAHGRRRAAPKWRCRRPSRHL